MRVLVIDDEKGIREILRDYLTVLGHDADVAADGADGLALLGERRYDLVLTDLVMPGLPGLSVAQTMRQRHPDLRIIVISGSGDHFDIAQLRQGGFGYLHKPVSFAEFRRVVGSEAGAVPAAGERRPS
jgi:two-component system capsular synthesis sensor histidine kinase RcsC